MQTTLLTNKDLDKYSNELDSIIKAVAMCNCTGCVSCMEAQDKVEYIVSKLETNLKLHKRKHLKVIK